MEAERTDRNQRQPGEGWTPRRFAFVLLAALGMAFPLVMTGAHSFFIRDYGVLGYPFVAYHRDCFWRGEWPLWNPFSNCGAPFLAQWGTMTLYPGSLIYLLFPLPWSLGYFCLGHLLLGGVGMFQLSRRWTASSFAACVAGLAFVFCGATFSCLQWPNYTVALGWMPWVVLWAERSWREGGRAIVVAAVVAALQCLSGVPEVVVMTWMVAGCLWIAECSRADRRGPVVLRFFCVAALVAGLTAVQLLPFLELLEHSQRDRHFATSKWAMPAWGWANLLVPLFHCFKTFQGPYMQGGQEFLTSYYPGAAILTLAIVAALGTRDRRVWILAGLAVSGLFLACGENGFLYPLVKRLLPVVGLARYPVKFVLLTAFALPLLAAYAVKNLESMADGTNRDRSLLVATGVAALVTMGVVVWMARQSPYQSAMWSAADKVRAAQLEWAAVWPNALARAGFLVAMVGGVLMLSRTPRARTRISIQCGLLALTIADILTHTSPQNPTLPVDAFARELRGSDAATALPQLGQGRVFISPGAESRLLYSETTNSLHDFLGKRLALWSNLNLLEGAPKVNGSSTLQIREQAEVQRLLYGTNRYGRGLVDFLGVSRFSAPQNPTEWIPREGSLPLVTCGQRPIFGEREEVLKGLVSEDFDPRKAVYLSPQDQSRVTVTAETDAKVLGMKISSGAVNIEVEAKQPSLVVIAQSFHRPWRATINGRDVPLLRANHAFQALEVPAGRHQVLASYRDRAFLVGGLISLLTFVGCAIGWWRARPGTPVEERSATATSRGGARLLQPADSARPKVSY